MAGMERPALLVRFLGLFRPVGRGMPWDRAGRALDEIRGLLALDEVAWDGGAAQPVRPGLWHQGMEVLLERAEAGKVSRPLKNTNLLRAVVYDLAKKQGAMQEREREDKLRYRPDVGRILADPHPRPLSQGERGGEPVDMAAMGANARALLEKLRGRK